jgi:hypothetical protein
LQEIPEPRIGAPLLEHPPDFAEFVREKFFGEREHQRFAEIEFLLVRDSEIFFFVVGIVRPLVGAVEGFSMPQKLAGFPAEDGLMLIQLRASVFFPFAASSARNPIALTWSLFDPRAPQRFVT